MRAFPFVLAILAATGPAAAQSVSIDLGAAGGAGNTSRLVQLTALIGLLALAPSLLVMATAFARVAPAVRVLAPGPDTGRLHRGPAGSGHFVKMIHNGIEYGMMQAYAEGFALMKARADFGLDLGAIADQQAMSSSPHTGPAVTPPPAAGLIPVAG